MSASTHKKTDDLIRKSVAGFTTPLGLMEHLRKPKMKLDMVPVLDLLVIGLLMSLLFTRFVMVPGVRVDLPDSDLRMPHHDASVAVLTIGNKGMLYFDGSVYEQGSIARAFNHHLSARDHIDEHVLLVKAEGTMSLQVFLNLCQMAQEAGFGQVQIAGEKKVEGTELVPTGNMRESQQFIPAVM
ncbi:MAG: ExbD/TolR family protein [Opitutaceae bacterium]